MEVFWAEVRPGGGRPGADPQTAKSITHTSDLGMAEVELEEAAVLSLPPQIPGIGGFLPSALIYLPL